MGRSGIINVTLLVLAIAISFPVYSLTTFPTTTEIDHYDNEQTLVLTILNDGPRTEQVRMMFDPYSAYLADYVTLEPAIFNLSPNSRKNVEITFNFPKDMSPETHSLVITPATDQEIGQSSTFYFTVPGEAKHDLKIESIQAGDITTEDPLMIDLNIYNRGNVIARAYPNIEIRNESGIVDSIEYKSMVMIMPYSRYDLSLRHDFMDPQAGNYTITTYMSYNDGKLETDTATTTFTISSEEKSNAISFGWSYLLVGIVALMAVLSIIFYSRHPKSDRLDIIRKRITLLEDELGRMVKETDDFIQTSNRWMKPRFGDQYEFR